MNRGYIRIFREVQVPFDPFAGAVTSKAIRVQQRRDLVGKGHITGGNGRNPPENQEQSGDGCEIFHNASYLTNYGAEMFRVNRKYLDIIGLYYTSASPPRL